MYRLLRPVARFAPGRTVLSLVAFALIALGTGAAGSGCTSKSALPDGLGRALPQASVERVDRVEGRLTRPPWTAEGTLVRHRRRTMGAEVEWEMQLESPNPAEGPQTIRYYMPDGRPLPVELGEKVRIRVSLPEAPNLTALTFEVEDADGARVAWLIERTTTSAPSKEGLRFIPTSQTAYLESRRFDNRCELVLDHRWAKVEIATEAWATKPDQSWMMRPGDTANTTIEDQAYELFLVDHVRTLRSDCPDITMNGFVAYLRKIITVDSELNETLTGVSTETQTAPPTRQSR